jgi:hypothetical protein
VTPTSFFVADGGGVYQPTLLTSGPWDPRLQHAGPPSALLAREIERSLPTETPFHVARVTVEIMKPIPVAPVRVAAVPLRAGRKVQWLTADLTGSDGTLLARASAVCIRQAEIPVPKPGDSNEDPLSSPAESAEFDMHFFQSPVSYRTGMDMRVARGTFGSGKISVWMRMRYPLVADEKPSPLQRVMIAADSGNGVSMMLDVRKYMFMNPDLTAYLHRLPVGEWVCLDARTIPQDNGVGLAETRLLDEQGTIGRSMQSLIIESRAG